jgi:hypothetical protein
LRLAGVKSVPELTSACVPEQPHPRLTKKRVVPGERFFETDPRLKETGYFQFPMMMKGAQ